MTITSRSTKVIFAVFFAFLVFFAVSAAPIGRAAAAGLEASLLVYTGEAVAASVLYSLGLSNDGQGFDDLCNTIAGSAGFQASVATSVGGALGEYIGKRGQAGLYNYAGKTRVPKDVVMSVYNEAQKAGAFSSGVPDLIPQNSSTYFYKTDPLKLPTSAYEAFPSKSLFYEAYNSAYKSMWNPAKVASAVWVIEYVQNGHPAIAYSTGAGDSSPYIRINGSYIQSNTISSTSFNVYSYQGSQYFAGGAVRITRDANTTVYLNWGNPGQAVAGVGQQTGAITGTPPAYGEGMDLTDLEGTIAQVADWNAQTVAVYHTFQGVAQPEVQTVPLTVVNNYYETTTITYEDARAGTTAQTVVDTGADSADQAVADTVALATVEENQGIISSVAEWADGYLRMNWNNAIFDKFPFCLPKDAYLLWCAVAGITPDDVPITMDDWTGDVDSDEYMPSNDLNGPPIIRVPLEFGDYDLSFEVDLDEYGSIIDLIRKGIGIVYLAALLSIAFRPKKGDDQ